MKKLYLNILAGFALITVTACNGGGSTSSGSGGGTPISIAGTYTEKYILVGPSSCPNMEPSTSIIKAGNIYCATETNCYSGSINQSNLNNCFDGQLVGPIIFTLAFYNCQFNNNQISFTESRGYIIDTESVNCTYNVVMTKQ